jgi:hypothetical protein
MTCVSAMLFQKVNRRRLPKVKSKETEVTLQTKTYSDNASQGLFRIMEGAIHCSPWVFYRLLAWESINAHMPSTVDTQGATLYAHKFEQQPAGKSGAK